MARKNEHTTFLRIFSAPLMIAAGVVSFFVFTPAVDAASMSPAAVIEAANRDRANMGLMPLALNDRLSAAAREKAKDMIKHDYFAHTSPQGHDPWYWIRQAGYTYKAAGENLAINYDDAKEQERAWMKSETHRANILNARYTETGVAVVEGKIDGETSLVTVQMFAQPAVAAAVHKSDATPVAQEPAVAPAIKGAETVEVPAMLPSLPALSGALPAVPEMLAPQADTWFEEVWYVAMALLIVAVLMAPTTLVAKSFSALYSHFVEEQLLHAAYQAEVMAAVLDAHIRAPSIQHSG